LLDNLERQHPPMYNGIVLQRQPPSDY